MGALPTERHAQHYNPWLTIVGGLTLSVLGGGAAGPRVGVPTQEGLEVGMWVGKWVGKRGKQRHLEPAGEESVAWGDLCLGNSWPGHRAVQAVGPDSRERVWEGVLPPAPCGPRPALAEGAASWARPPRCLWGPLLHAGITLPPCQHLAQAVGVHY